MMMGFKSVNLIYYALFLTILVNVNASIHHYNNEPFTHRSNAFFFHAGTEAIFSSSSSFIRFETVSFNRPRESAISYGQMQTHTGLVEAIILEVKDRNRIGGFYFNPKSDLICCTPDLAKEYNCNVGEVIIHNNPDNPDFPKRIKTFFRGIGEVAHMDPQIVEINATGMYYLYFMFCDPNLKGTTVTGKTVWRNPNGYLPGKMAPLMTLYGFMSLAYLLLGLLWFLRFLQFWKEKDIIHVHLHYHITAVIALGMCEMALWYFEYANFNVTGSRPMGITIWAVTFTSVKKTLSRLLLLVVSMGYGVVRPTLGAQGVAHRVVLLGVMYFVACEAFELVEHLGNINDFSGKSKLLLVLPVVCLDSCFILWIFSSLSKTLEKLQTRRNLAKLEIYRNNFRFNCHRISSCKAYSAVPPPQPVYTAVPPPQPVYTAVPSPQQVYSGPTAISPLQQGYSAVPPPQQLLAGVQSLATSTGVTTTSMSLTAVSTPIPLANAIGYTPPLVSGGTSYIGYGGIYPQATPLQQVALALRHPPPVASIVAPTTSGSSRESKSTTSSDHEKEDKRPSLRRKFQELPVVSKGTKHNQGLELLKPNERYDDLVVRNISNMPAPKKLIQPSSNGIQPPPPRTMPPPPPPKRAMPPPPPPPKFYDSTDVKVQDRSNNSWKTKHDAVPETLVKLMEYGDDDDDDDLDDSNEEILPRATKAIGAQKPFWAL